MPSNDKAISRALVTGGNGNLGEALSRLLMRSGYEVHVTVHDEHTRGAIVRGGSDYEPRTSHWYFPQAKRLDQHGKLLLMAPGKDRSGRIGFRCVVDAG